MDTHMSVESAQQGIQELYRFFDFLDKTNQKLAHRINTDEILRFKLFALFSGLTPINKLAEGDWNLVQKLIAALKDFGTPNIFCIVIDKCKKTKMQRFEFINRWAVQRVASMHSDIFPRPDRTVQWLEQNPTALCHESIPVGDFGHVIYGVLSGFPRSACETYLTFMCALSYLDNIGVATPVTSTNMSDFQRAYRSSNVALALQEHPAFLDVMQRTQIYGFGFFHCSVFSSDERGYVDELKGVFRQAYS